MSVAEHRADKRFQIAPELARKIHYVGSLPPDIAHTDLTAMQWFLDHAGEQELTGLPCDRDPLWILKYHGKLRELDTFDVVRDGSYAHYDDIPVYRLAPGRQLTPADVALGRTSEVAAVMAARHRLGSGTLPPHQVSIPAPLDLASFTFGVPAAASGLLSARATLSAFTATLKHLPVFTDAITHEIKEIHRRWGDEVIFQLESPAILAAFDRTPRALWRVVTALLVRHTASVIVKAPADAQFVLHGWCHGDLGHKPLARLRNLSPIIELANALAAHLRRHHRHVPPIHVALCHGEAPPSIDRRDYVPLRHLRRDVRLIAGLVDEDHPDHSARALQLTEQALGRPVLGVAAACGLGRRTPEAAERNVALARRLTHEAHTETE